MNRLKFAGGSNSRIGWSIMSKTTNKYSLEVGERAARMVLDNSGRHESHWTSIVSAKMGCAARTLNKWVKKTEVDRGDRAV